MPPLSRNTSRLLKKVGGEPHASSEDHYETGGQGSDGGAPPSPERVDYSPVSSSDEKPKPVSPPPKPAPLKGKNGARNPSSLHASEPKTRKRRKPTEIIKPKVGAYSKGLPRKENGVSSPQLEQDNVEEEPEPAEDIFGMSFGISNKRKLGSTPTQNIHAPVSAGVMSAPTKRVYGLAAARGAFDITI